MPVVLTTPFKLAATYYSEVIVDAPYNYWRLGESSGQVFANDLSAGGSPFGVDLVVSLLGSAHLTYSVAGGSVGDSDTGLESDNNETNESGTLTGGITPAALENVGTIEAIIAPRVAPTTANNTRLCIFSSARFTSAEGGRHFTLFYENPTGTQPVINAYFFHDSDNNTPLTISTANATLTLDEYTHIAVTYELGGSQDGIEIFIDGVSNGVTTMTNAGNGYESSFSFLSVFGSLAFTGIVGFGPGVIDELAIYDKVLSSTRIAAHAALVKGITV